MPVNLSAISKASFLGRAARLPLRLVPPNARMRILQGPGKGLRWIAGAHTHGCWLGSYELPKQRLLGRILAPGAVLYDIGANVGFYTLLGSRLVGPEGRVYAFEPHPRNLRYLREHLRINSITNTEVLPLAISDAAGEARFNTRTGPSEAGLAERGDTVVPTATLDGLLAAGKLKPPTCIKIDVEGAEWLVQGAARTLAEHRPTILLATHGPEVHAACTALLRQSGYTLNAIGSPGATVETTDELLATRG